MNNEFSSNIKKSMANKKAEGELTPGATSRRYEPNGGTQKHNERIQRESAFVDKYKKMPFSFSKPKSAKIPEIKICANCGEYVRVNKNSIGVICSSCKTFSKLLEVPHEEK